MKHSLPLVAALAFPLPLVSQAPSGPIDAWILKEPLSADPSELLRFSATHPPREGAEILELLEDSLIQIDEEGRKRLRYRYVFRVDHESAVESWGSVVAQWSPWYEGKPTIRARVISPDGRSHPLDPKTVGEFTPDNQGVLLLGDQKHLRGPLPKLGKGSIAEVVIETSETVPFSKSGVYAWAPLQQLVPVIRTRVRMELPSRMPLTFKVHGPRGSSPVQSSASGTTRLTMDLGPQDPVEAPEPFMPAEALRHPALVISTAESWAAVAGEYARILEGRAAAGDLSAWVAEATRGEVSREGKIARILARLHRDVRYTGVEFDDAAIVPAPPMETLKRGFGDCKEKANLLAVLLRTAGIPAEVALLNSGGKADIDPDLPGMAMFNHVITYVPGEKPLWIDATATHTMPGEVPFGVEGRWALIAAKGTEALVRIPEQVSSENVQREIRQVTFSESGPGSILETTEAIGTFRQRYLGDRVEAGEKQTREALEKYVKEHLSAKALGRIAYPEPDRPRGPFRMTLEAKETSTVAMDRTHAVTILKIWPLFSGLQGWLGEGRKEGDAAKIRQHDLVLPEPFVREMVYVIPCPPGYAPNPLPKDRDVDIGPARLRITHAASREGTVEVKYRIDTSRRRWTPAEVEEGLRVIKALGEEKEARILFSHEGESHLTAGRVKEALTEFRRLSALSPTKALPRTRSARALLAAGLGEAAREEARKAVALEPSLAIAHETLGWILQHDLVGRRFGAGWDRDAAIKCYREAKKLDAQSFSIRGDLAILLEHDAEGLRYRSKADLAAASVEYSALREDLEDKSLDHNLLVSLGRQGRFKETLDFAKNIPASKLRDGWLVVGLVNQLGMEQAIREAEILIPDAKSRRSAWVDSADEFIRQRNYSAAARALAEGANGSEQVSQIRARSELMAKVRPIEPDPLERKDPAGLLRQFIIAVTRAPKAIKEWSGFFSPAITASFTQEHVDRIVGDIKGKTHSLDLPVEVMADIVLSLGQFASTGDDARGHQVSIRMPDNTTHTFFVGATESGYRIVGSEDSLPSLGVEALWHSERKRDAQARAWLDQARQWLASPPADDPLGGSMFGRRWAQGQQSDERSLRIAAALLAYDVEPAKAEKVLRLASEDSRDASEMACIDLILTRIALNAKDYSKAESILPRLKSFQATSTSLNRSTVRILLALKKWDEALDIIQASLAKDPRSTYLLSARNAAFRGKGQREKMEQEIQGQIDQGLADAGIFNSLAWSHVARDGVSERTLEIARSATQGTGARNAASLHTLATVLALLGKTSDSRDALIQSLNLRNSEPVGANEWFVLGCIAERLDIRDVAQSCYRKAMDSPRQSDADDEDGCMKLASKRSSLLEAHGTKH